MVYRKLTRLITVLKEMLALPKVSIIMRGDRDSKSIYQYFTRLHPRYLIIQNKVWGVALLPLPNAFEDYLRGKEKQALRTNRKRILAEGFYFDEFSPMEYLEEILEINCSKAERQGRPMGKSYVEKTELSSYLEGITTMFGVFNSEKKLRAYAYVPIYGDIAIISRLLGHAEDLDNGIMYLLISEVIKHLIGLNKPLCPQWVMYDTFFGASSGLRYFKERLGFRPYKVKWSWHQ